DGQNTITFKQADNVNFAWGVTNVMFDTPEVVEVPVDTPVANLTQGVAHAGIYGNRYDGQSDDDGLISYTFDSVGEDIVLDFDGYDFDSDGEVEVYLNGTLVAPVESGLNNDWKEYRHEFAAEDLLDGQNTITFVQAAKVSFVWGVTNVNIHTAGDDRIEGTAGDDLFFGGEGNDTFLFAQGDAQDVIEDFALDGDLIELQNFGVTQFSELTITNDADLNAQLSFGGTDLLTLEGIDAGELTAAHFDFV
ncbi:hypothetical protein, partial [Rhodopirellula bahusiensis]|uniref:hypothetical protein n=1 Tax=Rhodopirellula bahusiensis TaxID=2014065 RepID=UPI0032679789